MIDEPTLNKKPMTHCPKCGAQVPYYPKYIVHGGVEFLEVKCSCGYMERCVVFEKQKEGLIKIEAAYKNATFHMEADTDPNATQYSANGVSYNQEQRTILMQAFTQWCQAMHAEELLSAIPREQRP
jgi:hypothetical protein